MISDGDAGADSPRETVERGALYVVSTPIGNLGDITLRAIEVLKGCDVVLAEDTRRSRTLLDHLGVRTPLESVREHNEASAAPRLVARLSSGGTAALVTDAGTPLVSDPGARLVTAAIEAGLAVIPVPGASALLAALVASGISAEPFTFLGFVPRKAGERRALAGFLAELQHTAVCYEAPGRVAGTLAEWVEAGLGDRRAAVAREMTKRFEEIRRGTVRDLAAYHEEHPVRGEVVLVIEGAPERQIDEDALAQLVRTWRTEGVPAREVARRLSMEHGVPRNLAYRLSHAE